MKHIAIQGSTVTVSQGGYAVAGKNVRVAETAAFPVEPADIVAVKDESLVLSDKTPAGWHSGTRLAGPNAWDINARGSYVPGSLVLRESPDGPALVEGQDYLLSPEFGMVGLAPGSRLSTTTPVFATYQYSLLRVDSVAVDAQGTAHLLKGAPHISAPCPPEVPPDWVRLLNVFRPYHATTVAPDDIFPVLEDAAMAPTRTTQGRIPETLRKIRASQPVRIVCLGDSVTAGGNASKPEFMYSQVFQTRLMARFYPSASQPPSGDTSNVASINVINESYGGSNSSMWLRVGPMANYVDEHPELRPRIDFDRVLAHKPDLVAIEFVNDAGYPRDVLELLYGTMLAKLREIGADVILITPHFTYLDMMKATSLRTPETRPYVTFLYEFAEKNGLGIADASSRWAHLWKEGLPYITLLHNTVNHPDDRGHALFADELMKNFD